MTRWLLLCALVAFGCGDDDLPPRPMADGGPRDFGTDTGPEDAGGDDADVPDMAEDGGTDIVCTAGERLPLAMDTSVVAERVALAAGSNAALAAWWANDGTFPNVAMRSLSAAGAGALTPVTDDFAAQRAVAVAFVNPGYLVSWFDNAAGMGNEIVTHAVDASGALQGSANVVTSGDGGRQNPALVRGPDGPILAFIDDGAGRRVFTVPLTAAGLADGTPTEVLGVSYGPSTPVLMERPASTPLLLTTDLNPGGETDERAVWLQPLTASGTADGSPVRVDLDGNAAGTVAGAATPDDNVGIVFDVRVAGIRNEVHFRPVLPDSTTPTGIEEVISDGQAKDPGIAPIGGGFAVAYRAVEDAPTLELAFVNVAGEVFQTLDLGATTPNGGAIAISATLEGNLWLAWTEQGDATVERFAMRVTCE